MKRTIITTKEPDGIRIQNILGNSIFIPEDEIDDVICEMVEMN